MTTTCRTGSGWSLPNPPPQRTEHFGRWKFGLGIAIFCPTSQFITELITPGLLWKDTGSHTATEPPGRGGGMAPWKSPYSARVRSWVSSLTPPANKGGLPHVSEDSSDPSGHSGVPSQTHLLEMHRPSVHWNSYLLHLSSAARAKGKKGSVSSSTPSWLHTILPTPVSSKFIQHSK